jgi:hypothetical protein
MTNYSDILQRKKETWIVMGGSGGGYKLAYSLEHCSFNKLLCAMA